MSNMTHTPSENHRTQLRNLVVMAFADGSLGHREINLVADRCAALGLSDVELHDAMQFGLSEKAEIVLPGTFAEKRSLMSDLIRMMAADGHLEESEKQLFALCAAKLNLTTEELDEIIDGSFGDSPT
jgi:uncharacterized tellurite resistance protein B-like protein